MDIPFSFLEFIIDPAHPTPMEVYDKILQHHIAAVLPYRLESGIELWPSANSGYRHRQWELDHNRDGTSEHTFEDKGATDWTTLATNLRDFAEYLITESGYTRVAWYPNDQFFHCDYKYPERGRRCFIARPAGWEQVDHPQLLKSI